MREIIWKYGDHFTILDADGNEKVVNMWASAVDLSLAVIPLVPDFGVDSPALGRAHELKRQGGDITCKLEFFSETTKEFWEEQKKSGLYRLGGYYWAVEKTADQTRVTKAELRAVSIVEDPKFRAIPKDFRP